MSTKNLPARTSLPRARRPPPDPGTPHSRGVSVFVEVPEGEGYPDSAELLDLAGALYELAQDLVPGATTHTEVRLTDGHPATTEPGPRP